MVIAELSEATWRKSTRSGSDTDCVEVAAVAHAVGVRDSKDRSGPVLAFDRSAWSAFVADLSTRPSSW
ncbi:MULTISPECIES: DUF397 domain-containing protein [unclassified Micromonospora]|uniref:DUF397 domain-containing protein n=1 Tax=unclassified Micromonospora TaxID=2617518 RepID=UPI001C5D42BF|nr:DUF397 domain-containing protein [Micromonospora sp. RL09-050-HVF-A]MBW4704329.1 DUF397 domain-containing protein [Micromonospora sp. RL09-050-HVF-A]